MDARFTPFFSPSLCFRHRSDQQPPLSTTKICDIVSDRTLQQINNDVCGTRDDHLSTTSSVSNANSSQSAINTKYNRDRNIVPKQQQQQSQSITSDICNTGNNSGRRLHSGNQSRSAATNNGLNNNSHRCCNNNSITIATTSTSTSTSLAQSSGQSANISIPKRNTHKNNK